MSCCGWEEGVGTAAEVQTGVVAGVRTSVAGLLRAEFGSRNSERTGPDDGSTSLCVVSIVPPTGVSTCVTGAFDTGCCVTLVTAACCLLFTGAFDLVI